MRHINLWYAHQLITVWMLTKVPAGWSINPYHERGWPSFEFAIACMITPFSMVVDLGQLNETLTDYSKIWLNCKQRRKPPTVPDRFQEELRQKHFTNGADCAMVENKYRETFEAVMGGALTLSFADMGWGESEATILAQSLPHCRRLRMLDLDFKPLGDAGVVALAPALCTCT